MKFGIFFETSVPRHPVSASVVSASITLPPIRFVCRPDVLAFAGTEKV